MTTYLYVVEALRSGDREQHSYVVGVYSSLTAAQLVADNHASFRGGKYVCQVNFCSLNEEMNTDWNQTILYQTR